ncbi:MAG: heavy metal translocating P-type ATPase metal-binding domain-containing protein, partial [Phaeodactylibacter sp.]|nr:heavy metal translocating P-type ATPase metal-binding domain-containing protein [Phaeodactylibacter sp.]
CADSPVQLEDKAFCCEGCKMVYEILNSNGLCNYYDLEQNPGVRLKGRKLEQYAYLDDPEVVDQLIDFSDGQQTKVHFHLPQIHCASCIWLLENLYKLNDGVVASTVNFPKKEINIRFLNEETTLRAIVELLASIGYAPAINLGNLDAPKQKAVDRTIFYKLGVAGFAFGNIMLMSFPEYLGLHTAPDQEFQIWLGALNILLALPVVFYSGWDYLKSAFLGLKHRYLNMDVPISLGILTLFIRSLYEILTFTGAGYLDSLAGLVFFLLIGKWFQQKTFHHLSFERDYRSYFPIAATVREGDEEYDLVVSKLKKGQIIIVRNGELIPADGILLKGQGHIDYSFVTGEADPVDRYVGDKLYAGGRQTGERIEVQLTKKVSQSYLTQLWNEEAFQKEQKSHTSQLADRVARLFTVIILTIAFATLFYWLPKDITLAINAFSAVLIIACPCAVALTVPFTFGNSLRILAQNGFFLKNVQVIETLQTASAIVFDKTGTLTGTQRAQVQFEGETLRAEEERWVRSLCLQSSHPLSRQIAESLDVPALPIEAFEEITGQGIQGRVDGQQIKVGSQQFIGAAENHSNKRGVYVAINGEIKGSFNLDNALRPGLSTLMQQLKVGFKRFLLSGDNDRERARLEPYFDGAEQLRFQQSPKDKLDFIKKLQAERETVVMIGDGLNDAGALKQSNCGIVIADDTNNFTPASDAILAADQFERLPAFIRFAKGNLKLVYVAYFLALIYNI